MSDDTPSCDVAIVGGGAAGLATAIFTAEHATTRLRVVVLDGAPRIGAKILIAGGGRCNVTNDVVRPEDFNGSRPIVRNVLAAFDAAATVRWFERMGVALKREATGKLFPVSDRAQTVIDALLARCAALGIRIATGHRISDVVASGGTSARQEARQQSGGDEPSAHDARQRGGSDDAMWVVRHSRGDLRARAVVLATGGRSLPRTGSDGAGWAIVARLGHGVTPTVPALVPLVLQSTFHRELSGVSHPAELQTFVDGKLADRRDGSLLWTHFGVSGPVVLDASRHWTLARDAGRDASVRCNFFPGESFDAIDARLVATARTRSRVTVARALAATLPDRVAAMLATAAGVAPTTHLAEVSRVERRAVAHAATAFVLPIERDRGWDFAEVTAGGVPLDEIDYRTMQSRKQPALYLVGEMLDCDGRIGGFNFQWAWSTGFVAGKAAASRHGH